LNSFWLFGAKIIYILDSPWAGITPLIGSTLSESPESGSPLMLSLSKEKGIGTSYKFFRFTISLFFPPINNGPKLIFPESKNTLGSTTVPTTRKCCVILSLGISNTQ
jgi:hypothetical protein